MKLGFVHCPGLGVGDGAEVGGGLGGGSGLGVGVDVGFGAGVGVDVGVSVGVGVGLVIGVPVGVGVRALVDVGRNASVAVVTATFPCSGSVVCDESQAEINTTTTTRTPIRFARKVLNALVPKAESCLDKRTSFARAARIFDRRV